MGAQLGILADIGVPEEQAREYAHAIRAGEGVVALEHDGTRDMADVFRGCGCRDVRDY